MDSAILVTVTILYSLLQAASGDPSNNAICIDVGLLDCSTDVKREICGSNGVTYGTSCDFAKARCADDSIALAYEGPCSPVPKPDPICSSLVNVQCPVFSNLVCASDGSTYTNFCEFEKFKCQSPSLTLISLGVCPTPTTTMATTSQSILDLICQSLETVSCPIGQPKVCGSDGITYDSGCDLEKANCKSDTTITLVREGAC